VLTPDLEQLIDEQLAHGRLRTPKEVVREALLLLRERTPEEVPRPQQVRPPALQLSDVMGQWPGDESDEEVFAALEKLS